MTSEIQTEKIFSQERVQQMVDEILSAWPQYFCVLVKIKPTNNIKIYIDGDEGITIEKCVLFNRSLRKMIEDAGWFPEGDFSLEVSSPGIDEPLKLKRQYIKNINRKVEVLQNDETKIEGILKNVNEEGIDIEYTTGKGKKAITEQVTISFDNIKKTTVQILF